MTLFGSTRIIHTDEMAKVIEWLVGHISDGEELRSRISGLASIRPRSEQEKLYLNLYLEVEHLVCQQDSKLCPSPRALRSTIAQKFGLAKFAPTFFTAPFLPQERQVFFLFRIVLEQFIKYLKLTPQTLQGILNSPNASNALRSLQFSDGNIEWHMLEEQYGKLSPDMQGKQLVSDFGYLIHRLFREMQQRVGEERARLSADEIFKNIASLFSFLDSLPALLPLLPAGVLEHERILFYSKGKLTEELQKRMRELEATNVSLQEEARKLRSAVSQLQAAQERMQAMQAAQGEFIRVVSHQFRTPLSVIRWQSEVLAESLEKLGMEKISTKAIEEIHSINQKAIFLADVLNGVFDLLALESGEFKINRRPVALWEIIDDVTKSRQREATTRNIRFEFSKEASPIDEAYIDQEMIKKVVDILVANALQYSNENGKVSVLLSKEQREQEGALFRVRLSDNGIGIPLEDQRSIFQKFYRSDSAKRKSPDGAGIALYITKRFIDLHGGEIGFTSEGTGKGTTFWFTVPQGNVENS